MTLLRISDVIEDRHATSLLACIFLRGRMPKTTLAQSVSNIVSYLIFFNN